MSKEVVEVQVRAVLPSQTGRAIFIGNEDKVFVIHVDPSVGDAIRMFLRNIPKQRPLTHDLICHVLTALGAKVTRVVINDIQDATYFARLILSAENELLERKLVEIDARPSDCLALAIQQKAPIYVSRHVWDTVEDMSEVLRKMEEGDFETGEAEAEEEE
jgi:uncharacterized protein